MASSISPPVVAASRPFPRATVASGSIPAIPAVVLSTSPTACPSDLGAPIILTEDHDTEARDRPLAPEDQSLMDHLRTRDAELDAELEELRTEELMHRIALKEEAVATARAALKVRAGAALPSPPPPSSDTVAVGPSQTPARSSGLRPRVLAFQSTVGRRAPSAAAVAHQRSIDQLPDSISEAMHRAPVTTTFSDVRPITRAHVKIVTPEKFSGEDKDQCERVENWIDEVDEWLHLSNVDPALHLDYARTLFSSKGRVRTWLRLKDDELAHANKSMTWDWLKLQLMRQYGQPSGAAAQQAEWQALRMGIKNKDGSETGGKSTWTVSAYTDLFLTYMRYLTSHTVNTTDILVIDRYVLGIKVGYDALYKAMLGVQRVLRFETLAEAIEGAHIAEVDLNIGKASNRSSASSSSSGWPTQQSRYRGNRAPTEALNNVEGERSDEGEGDTDSPATSKAKVYGFVFRPSPNDGRYKLKELEAKMLYDDKRCYRCYKAHLFGPGHPRCSAPVQKVPPIQSK